MNIKVLNIKNFFRDPATAFGYEEREPVFNRDGVYLVHDLCWVEYNGKAFEYEPRQFRFVLKTFDSPILRHCEYKTLSELPRHLLSKNKGS